VTLRFRNLAAVGSTAHGSQIDEFLTTEIDGEKWTCIRPTRRLSRLEFDVKSKGFCQVPVVLFNSSPAACHLDDENRVWYSNLPEPHEIATSFLLADDWLSDRLAERRFVFDAIKTQVDAIHATLEADYVKTEAVVEHLRAWKELCTEAFPYMFLVLTIDDLVLHLAQRWIDRQCSPGQRTELLAQVCRSVYVRNAIANNAIPRLSKSLQFPPSQLFRSIGYIDRSIFLRSEALANVIARCEVWHKAQTILHVTERASLAFQLSEENFHVMGSLTTACENLLYRFSLSVAPEAPTEFANRYRDLTLEECVADIQSRSTRRKT